MSTLRWENLFVGLSLFSASLLLLPDNAFADRPVAQMQSNQNLQSGIGDAGQKIQERMQRIQQIDQQLQQEGLDDAKKKELEEEKERLQREIGELAQQMQANQQAQQNPQDQGGSGQGGGGQGGGEQGGGGQQGGGQQGGGQQGGDQGGGEQANQEGNQQPLTQNDGQLEGLKNEDTAKDNNEDLGELFTKLRDQQEPEMKKEPVSDQSFPTNQLVKLEEAAPIDNFTANQPDGKREPAAPKGKARTSLSRRTGSGNLNRIPTNARRTNSADAIGGGAGPALVRSGGGGASGSPAFTASFSTADLDREIARGIRAFTEHGGSGGGAPVAPVNGAGGGFDLGALLGGSSSISMPESSEPTIVTASVGGVVLGPASRSLSRAITGRSKFPLSGPMQVFMQRNHFRVGGSSRAIKNRIILAEKPLQTAKRKIPQQHYERVGSSND